MFEQGHQDFRIDLVGGIKIDVSAKFAVTQQDPGRILQLRTIGKRKLNVVLVNENPTEPTSDGRSKTLVSTTSQSDAGTIELTVVQ